MMEEVNTSTPEAIEQAANDICKVFSEDGEDISWPAFNNAVTQNLVCIVSKDQPIAHTNIGIA